MSIFTYFNKRRNEKFTKAIEAGNINKVNIFLKKGKININYKNSLGMTPLHFAVITNQTMIIKRLLDSGAHINYRDKEGYSALHYALTKDNDFKSWLRSSLNLDTNLEKDDCEIATILLKRGADPNKQTLRDGHTPLHFAVIENATCENYEKIVYLLLAHGADIFIKNKEGKTPIDIATKKGIPLATTIRNISELNQKLQRAVQLGKLEEAKCWIDAGAKVQAWVDEVPIFHSACSLNKEKFEEKHLSIIELLLDSGADIDVCDSDGWTLIMLAANLNLHQTVKLLIDKGADTSIVNNDGKTVFQIILDIYDYKYEYDERYFSLFKTLLESTVDGKQWFNSPESNDWKKAHQTDKTASIPTKTVGVAGKNISELNEKLQKAVESGELEKAKSLIDAGADVQAYVYEEPIFYSACSYDEEETLSITELLLDSGADIDVCDSDGWTLIMLAAYNNLPRVVKFLIEKKADTSITNNDGKTVFQLILDQHNGSYFDVFKILVESTIDGKQWFDSPESSSWKEAHQIDKTAPIPVRTVDVIDILRRAFYNEGEELDQIIQWVNSGGDINWKTPNGWTLLHLAAQCGNERMVRYLAEHNFDIYARDGRDHTPLMLACQTGYTSLKINPEVIKALLEIGSDLGSKGHDARRALSMIEHMEKPEIKEIAALLKNSGAQNASIEYKSECIPDFPSTPQKFAGKPGDAITGQLLADICHVGEIIVSEFENWKLNDKNWPSYGDNELAAFHKALGRMRAEVASDIFSNVNTLDIRKLARSYIGRVREDEKAYSNFINGKWTLLKLSVDFANTLACGGTLSTALHWYE